MAGERALPGLGLFAYWTLGSNGWNDQNDQNIRNLSALVQCNVISTVAAEPGAPTDGDMHLLSGTANANKIAVRDNGAWVYLTPAEGWWLYDRTLDRFKVYDGTAWQTANVIPTFVSLPDTPANYTGSGGYTLKVNSGATAVEFVDEGGGIVAVAASRSLAITDRNDVIEVTTSPGAVDLTIPTDATVNFPIGTVIGITNLDAVNTLNVKGAAGVSLNGIGAGTAEVTATVYAGVTIYKRAADAWVIQGQHEGVL